MVQCSKDDVLFSIGRCMLLKKPLFRYSVVCVPALLACTEPKSEVESNPYPRLMVTADMRETIQNRIEKAPYAHIYQTLVEAALDDVQIPQGDAWDHDAWGHNGELAQHNAMLAWLHDDAQAAQKSLALLEMLDDDFESNETWDVNISMPHSLMGYTNALDLLRGTDFISADQVVEAQQKITKINQDFPTFG